MTSHSSRTRARVPYRVLLLTLLFCLLPSLVMAGTFKVVTVSYRSWNLNADYFYAEVQSIARYDSGTVDPGDNGWLIQTSLNDSYDDDLDEWSPADYSGPGKSGVGIMPLMQIVCDASCAAWGELLRPPCEGPDAYFKGRGGTVIYHQWNPEIDTRLGQAKTIPCSSGGPDPDPDPGGGGCLTSTANDQFLLPLDDAPAPPLRHIPSHLLRTEPGTLHGGERPMLYLREEWAVLSYSLGKEATVEIGATSDEDFAAQKAQQLRWVAQALPAGEGRRLVLLIEAPAHPRIGRQIPPPAPRIEKRRGPFALAPGWALVRADFSEQRKLTEVELLVGEGIGEGALREHLESALTLSYVDDRTHRVVLYALVRSDGDALEIAGSRAVQPRCCCGEFICL